MTDTVILPPIAAGFQAIGDTVSVADAAACVTVIVLVNDPVITVIVPVLFIGLVFCVAVTVRLPLPFPPDGETINHDGVLL